MQTANVAAMKYLCVKTAVADYLCEALGMTLEEVTASRGYDVPEEMIAQLNSPEGRGTSFSPLDEGSTYTCNHPADVQLVRRHGFRFEERQQRRQ